MPSFRREDIRKDTEEIVSRVIDRAVDDLTTVIREGFQETSEHFLRLERVVDNHEQRIRSLESRAGSSQP